VHSATLRQDGTWAMLGCLVYREDTAQFSFFPKTGVLFDECSSGQERALAGDPRGR
jgi:hypothetical protein